MILSMMPLTERQTYLTKKKRKVYIIKFKNQCATLTIFFPYFNKKILIIQKFITLDVTFYFKYIIAAIFTHMHEYIKHIE